MDKAHPSLELVPIDPPDGQAAPASPPPAAPAPAPTLGERTLAIEIRPAERTQPIATGTGTRVDPYAIQAAREYAERHIDQPLWDRAMTQADGDKTAAAAIYVRSRATALRLLDRGPAGRATARPRRMDPAGDNWTPRRESVLVTYRTPIIAAGVIVPLVVGAALFAISMWSSPPTEVVAATSRALPAKAGTEAKAAAKTKDAAPTPAGPGLEKKVQELRDIGNWNVMVLYAVEWTRKEPGNAAAWDALRGGYLRLKQYDEAANAANKAVQLAPDEAKLWRSLAEAHLDRDDPTQALAAFEQAAARNEHDLESHYQVGLLSARLGHPQAARAAFDRALAVKPSDPIAQCLRTAVAQIPPARDTYTMAVQIRQIDNRCHGRGDAAANATK